MVKCPRCNGKGYCKEHDIDAFLGAISFGVTILMDLCFPDEYWCEVCNQEGYININEND